MGSKRRLAKDLIPIISKELKEDSYYIEPFCGGCNLIDKIPHHKKIANDSNEYLIELLRYVQTNKDLPKDISREEYIKVRDNKEQYPKWYVGFIGFCCSYKGKFFDGYCGNGIKTKEGIRNYQQEQTNNLLKQNLKDIIFIVGDYKSVTPPPKSIIYCDPPYKATTQYKTDSFNHNEFWEWVREKAREGHKVYVSEYNAPDDFKCIWEKEQTKNLSGKTQKTTERLFVYEN